MTDPDPERLWRESAQTPSRVVWSGRRYGGAYVFNGGRAGLGEPILIAGRDGIEVLCVDYRMPPSHPFPAGLDDAVRVYKKVLEKMPSGSVAVGGLRREGALPWPCF